MSWDNVSKANVLVIAPVAVVMVIVNLNNCLTFVNEKWGWNIVGYPSHFNLSVSCNISSLVSDPGGTNAIWHCFCDSSYDHHIHQWQYQLWDSRSIQVSTYLSNYTRYFQEPHCLSTWVGLPEISRVTLARVQTGVTVTPSCVISFVTKRGWRER